MLFRSNLGPKHSDTLSLLASIDLPAREVTPLAGETRESPDYAGFLRILDGKYPRGDLTWIVPGDVSARIPAKTRRYLATVPGRLGLVSAPRHGSRPDLAGSLLPRTARRTLRDIRVSGKDELKERILRHLGRRAPSRSSTGGGGT